MRTSIDRPAVRPKKVATLLLLVATLSGAASPLAGQAGQDGTRSPVPHSNLVSANPFLLLFGWFNAELEHRFRPTATFGIAGSALDLNDGDDEYANLAAFLRYYPQEAALSGFFFGGRVGVHRAESTSGASASFPGLGLELGYTWLLGSDRHFAISIGAGANRLFGEDLADFSATIPTLRLVNVGWAF